MQVRAYRSLQDIRTSNPEYSPWIDLIELTFEECDKPEWSQVEIFPNIGSRDPAPYIHGANITLRQQLLQDWAHKLLTKGIGESESINKMIESNLPELTSAAISQDMANAETICSQYGLDEKSMEVMLPLLVTPLLRSISIKAASYAVIDAGERRYCPICGAWPLLLEYRGLDRSRYLRCGRCAFGWEISWSICPFCGNRDHRSLESISTQVNSLRKVETCSQCKSYIKAITTLDALHPDELLAEDLASVELDLIALSNGFQRPSGLGFQPITLVTLKGSRRGLWPWIKT